MLIQNLMTQYMVYVAWRSLC